MQGLIRLAVIVTIGFFLYACAAGLATGYGAATERKDVHILSENQFHVFSDNHMLSDNQYHNQGSPVGVIVLVLVAGFGLMILLGGKGGNHEQ